jgi:GTP cyclohydrolase II
VHVLTVMVRTIKAPIYVIAQSRITKGECARVSDLRIARCCGDLCEADVDHATEVGADTSSVTSVGVQIVRKHLETTQLSTFAQDTNQRTCSSCSSPTRDRLLPPRLRSDGKKAYPMDTASEDPKGDFQELAETPDSEQVVRVRRVASTRLPTKWGLFRAFGFEQHFVNSTQRVETALALVLGDLGHGAPLLRIHSQCLTGELFHSLRCDCSDQLDLAMRAIAEEGRGLVIYEHQEGRGIGLMAKLQAYALQDTGLDTVEANHALGFETDYRDFSLPAEILRQLGIDRVRLLSNNPSKAHALRLRGIEVLCELPCQAAPTPHSFGYLRTKRDKLGHALDLATRENAGLAP